MGKAVVSIVGGMMLFSLKAAAQLHFKAAEDSIQSVKKISLLPQNFYTQHLSFFCKKEDQIQKKTGLNLHFRLGTKDYVDWMEQKPNSVRPR